MRLLYQQINSPIGTLYIATDTKSLRIVAMEANWEKLKNNFTEVIEKEHPIITDTKIQLKEYFSKKRTLFDLPIDFEGTEFQLKTWNSLLEIPYGETRTYSQQAENIDNPKAVRAIGRTNGLNPISIIVPCHRVIGKNGSLTGYAGGVEAKKFLLQLESSFIGFIS